MASIRPNPYQPRERFDEEQLNELTESIREVGILQPVLVRPVGARTAPAIDCWRICEVVLVGAP